jgi:AraC-like DNA-binding protein
MEQISLPSESEFDINCFLKNLHLLTGMTVTLYNSYKLWVASYPDSACRFCKLLRGNVDFHMRCRANDSEAFNLCSKKGEMIVYRCYKGLYEIMIPLYDQDSTSGYLLLGQVMDDREESRSKYIEELALARPDLSMDELENAVDSSHVLSEEKLLAAAHVARIYADYVSSRNLLKQEVNSLANLVAVYIREHLTEKITNAELCYVFLCDRKKMTSEFKKVHGMTIVEYTNHLRLRLARQMLQKNPNLTISYVSSAAGFAYQGYFSTLFYKKYGMSPTDMQTKYREEMKKQTQKEE